MLRSFWANLDSWGPPGIGVMTIFGSYVYLHSLLPAFALPVPTTCTSPSFPSSPWLGERRGERVSGGAEWGWREGRKIGEGREKGAERGFVRHISNIPIFLHILLCTLIYPYIPSNSCIYFIFFDIPPYIFQNIQYWENEDQLKTQKWSWLKPQGIPKGQNLASSSGKPKGCQF